MVVPPSAFALLAPDTSLVRGFAQRFLLSSAAGDGSYQWISLTQHCRLRPINRHFITYTIPVCVFPNPSRGVIPRPWGCCVL